MYNMHLQLYIDVHVCICVHGACGYTKLFKRPLTQSEDSALAATYVRANVRILFSSPCIALYNFTRMHCTS